MDLQNQADMSRMYQQYQAQFQLSQLKQQIAELNQVNQHLTADRSSMAQQTERARAQYTLLFDHNKLLQQQVKLNQQLQTRMGRVKEVEPAQPPKPANPVNEPGQLPDPAEIEALKQQILQLNSECDSLKEKISLSRQADATGAAIRTKDDMWALVRRQIAVVAEKCAVVRKSLDEDAPVQDDDLGQISAAAKAIKDYFIK